MDTIVSEDMTSKDTQDILMGKLLDIEQISDQNHEIVMKSLGAVVKIIGVLNERITQLEDKVNE